MRKIITSILIVLLAATMCSAQIETSPRIMSSRTEIARQIHDSLATHEFLGDAGSIAYQDSDAVSIVGGNVDPDTLVLPMDGAPWKNGQLTYSSSYLKLYNSGIYTFPNTSYLALNYLTIAALTDSINKYRTAYKLDTTAIDTSQWHEIIRDWSDGGSYSLADNAVTVAKLDTVAAGWIDVRKFGATGDGVTDDTDAIRAALTYATGKNLLFPAGTYLSDSLVVPVKTYVLGYTGAILKLNDSQTCTNFITLSDSCTFSGMEVDANRANQADEMNIVMINHKKNVVVKDCNLYAGSSCGIVALRGQQIKILNNRIHNIYSKSAGTAYPDVATGILFYSSSNDADGNYRVADGNEVYDIGIVGITANPAAKNVVISNNSIHALGYSGGSGVLAIELFNAGDKCIVTGNVIEDIVKNDVGGWILSIAMARGTVVTDNVIVVSDSVGNAVEWFATNSVFANNTIRVQNGARVSDALVRMSAASNNIITGNSIYVWGFASCVFSLEGTGTFGWRDSHYSDNYDSLGCWNNNISNNTVMGDSSLGAFIYCASRNYNTTVSGNTVRSRQALFVTDAVDLNVFDNDFTCTDTTNGDSYASVAMGGTVHGINRVNIVGNNFVTNRNCFVINGADTVNIADNIIHLGTDPKKDPLPFWATTASDLVRVDNNVLGSGFSGLYYTNTTPAKGWYYGISNKGTAFGITQTGYNWAVGTGGWKATDSLTVGAGGVWMRNMYQSGNDLGIIFYNSALGRIDTVFAKQP